MLSCFLQRLEAKLEAVIPARENTMMTSTVPIYLEVTDLRGPLLPCLAARDMLTLLHTQQFKIRRLTIAQLIPRAEQPCIWYLRLFPKDPGSFWTSTLV